MTAHDRSVTAPQKARLRVADFMLLNDSGAFDAYRKTELLDGEIYFMNAQYRRHLLAKTDLYDALRDALRELNWPARLLMEGSVEFGDRNMPQPDIFLTSEPYGEGAVPGNSVSLVIEVADSTQRIDLGKKAAIYARAGVPEYWVLDTEACIGHQHWLPEDGAYSQRREIALGQPISAETIAGLTVTLPR